MHFLIDANMPRSTAALLASYAHVSTDVRDIGLGRAKDAEIAQHAKDHRLCILTGDRDFGDIRFYPPSEYQGIVVIAVPEGALPRDILHVVRMLLDSPQIIDDLPGRLAIVSRRGIRLRPPPVGDEP